VRGGFYFLRAFKKNATEHIGSSSCSLPQCSLQDRVERAREPGPISLGQWSRSTGCRA
jgi:hypothetical protein